MTPIADFLSQVTLFRDLDGEALATLTPFLTQKRFASGSVVFREADESDALYIVERGSVAVSKHVQDDVDIILTRFHAGDFFGEMGLFDAAPRSATANVTVDALLWRLERAAFHAIFSHHPDIAAKICYRLVIVFIERLRATNEQTREAIRWGLEATGYSLGGAQALFGRKST